MGTNKHRVWADSRKRTLATGGKPLLISLGLLLAGLAGPGIMVPTALANTSSPLESSATTPEHGAVNSSASACGTLPIEAYVTHDSTTLKESFCELLTFTPFNFSGIESFFREITPGSFTSNDEPSPEAMTLPSLWWSQNSLPRQFGSYRLVESWTAYEIRSSATRVVDIHINPQIWRILQYSERYGALSHLAAEAKNYRYNLRLFNHNLRDPHLIGLYVCDFSTSRPVAQANLDEIQVSPAGCVALIDADTIVRLQANLARSEGLAQQAPSPSQNPSQRAVAESMFPSP